jgi:hypothetical protein
MSRYYKTAKSAPIVDYTVEYPFDELFRASKYRNELQDTRTDKLNQAYDDVLGLNFIPGVTDENGVYQPSPSELYIKGKRQAIEDLINNYSGTDLTKSAWGGINRDITTITNDPTLADIQTSYNNYIKNQAHQRELDKAGLLSDVNPWGPAGDPSQQMWDVQSQGIYPFQPVKAYHDPSALLERYYKDLNVDEVFDPITGLIKKEVKQDDIIRVAKGMDETFLSTPQGQDAIANYRLANDGAPNMSDLDIARQVIQDYGQKYLGLDYQGGKTDSSSGNKNNKNGINFAIAPALLPGTEWAVSNNTVTTPEIMDKIATPIGDGAYTIESGVPVYINPIQIDRDGSSNDLITAYNVGVTKKFLSEYGDLIDDLAWNYGEGGGLTTPRDYTKENQRIEIAKTKYQQIIKQYDYNGDGKVDRNDKISSHKYGDSTQWPDEMWNDWYASTIGIYETNVANAEFALKDKKRVHSIVDAGEAEKRDNLSLQIQNAAAEYATLYNVDVMDPKLRELTKNWKNDVKDLEGLDLSNDEMKQLLAMELSDLASSGGIWQHISNAPTKTMIVDRDETTGFPVAAKFIQGNMIFTSDQLEDWFVDRGYGEEGAQFGETMSWFIGMNPDDWDDMFVGEESKYNLFRKYIPSPASELYDDSDDPVSYYIMDGAWRQVNDSWPVANNINQPFYGTGEGGNEQRAIQQELYNQQRNENNRDAIFGQMLQQNQLRNWVNTKRMYSTNLPPGTQSMRGPVAANINDFIETEINSGDSNRVDAATTLEKYLTDNGLWQNGYNENSTFGTGEFKDHRIYDTDEIDDMPWMHEENQDAMKVGQFVDLFAKKIETDDQRNLIYDHIASWEGDGSYGGVSYVKDGKFVSTTAGINAYKKSAENRASIMGLNEIDGTMFSSMTMQDDVYAPYVTNSAKSVLNNLNTLAAALQENFIITGLYRTPEYNATVGGMKGSAHTQGRAIDLKLNDRFIAYLNSSAQSKKVSKNKYVMYHQNGNPMFSVLIEDDHLHIESYQ